MSSTRRTDAAAEGAGGHRPRTVVGFPPLANPEAADPVLAGPLGDDALARLAELARPLGAVPHGELAGGGTDRWARHVDVQRRAGTVSASYWWRHVELSDDANAPVRGELRQLVEEVNVRTFRFDLTEFDPADPMVLLRFELGDRRVPLMDLHGDRSRRKLTILVPLTDPEEREGGDIVLPGAPVEPDQRFGHVTVVPSWLEWGVFPVTAGSAAVAVCWAHGPPFR